MVGLLQNVASTCIQPFSAGVPPGTTLDRLIGSKWNILFTLFSSFCFGASTSVARC